MRTQLRILLKKLINKAADLKAVLKVHLQGIGQAKVAKLYLKKKSQVTQI